MEQKALPGLNIDGGREWMALGPRCPILKPVIGPSPRHSNVLFAFGHGHLGLTQGATTGRLVAELALGGAYVPSTLLPSELIGSSSIAADGSNDCVA